jgi:rhamnosyltransferase
MNRLAVFAHYDKDDLVDQYVWYYLDNLKAVSDSIAFVTTSKIGQSDITTLKTICDKVIVRENIGYDFMSWRTGINSTGNIADFDELIICNDSVYGPLYPLDNIFDAMGKKDCDFWGMTDNYEIAYHLQSYFLVFKKSVINSEGFKDFWNGVTPERTKDEVIRKYELGLTESLMSAGFKPCAYAPIPPSIGRAIKVKAQSAFRRPSQTLKTLSRMLSKRGQVNYAGLNPTHFFWKELIVKYRMPFVKIDLLRDNRLNINIKGYEDIIRKYSNYDLDLIRKHLQRVKHEI